MRRFCPIDKNYLPCFDDDAAEAALLSVSAIALEGDGETRCPIDKNYLSCFDEHAAEAALLL
jgi:hypothetical protein